MTVLHALWLPIVLASVFVFIASCVIHMALGYHRHDYGRVPSEAPVMDAIRPFAIPPGDYMMPRCDSMREMGSPEHLGKLERGPVIIMTVLPNGRTSMGRAMGCWFAFVVVVTAFTAYLACHALPVGAMAGDVARTAGLTSFLGYAAAAWPLTIWYRRGIGITLRTTLDGAIYGAVTAATFAWLWPR